MLYHFSAISAAGSYKDIIGILQWSTDCGETFSKPKIVWPDHGIAQQIVVTIIKSRKGDVLIPCDRWGTQLPYGPSLNSQVRSPLPSYPTSMCHPTFSLRFSFCLNIPVHYSARFDRAHC